jgi:hypothetical protein
LNIVDIMEVQCKRPFLDEAYLSEMGYQSAAGDREILTAGWSLAVPSAWHEHYLKCSLAPPRPFRLSITRNRDGIFRGQSRFDPKYTLPVREYITVTSSNKSSGKDERVVLADTR